MASAVLVTMLFLMPLFYYTPNVILSAIIITAVIGLIDFGAAARLWKVDKLDFLAFISAFVGVLFISVQGGLTIAVRDISNFFFFNHDLSRKLYISLHIKKLKVKKKLRPVYVDPNSFIFK
jgi:MFS superfamily sulfate permease-like transporter